MPPREKVRSLGTMKWPSVRMVRFSGRANEVVIELSDCNNGKMRKLTIVSTVGCYSLIRLIRQIATAQADFAADQENLANMLKNRIHFEEDRAEKEGRNE